MERSGAPQPGEAEGVPPVTAMAACAAMAAFYVAVLYSPTVVLRLPPPLSLESFLFRRFACAAVSSAVSVFLCSLLLPIRNLHGAMSFFGVYGVRADHMWQALVIPFLLTSLLYAGSFISMIGLLCSSWKEIGCCSISAEHVKNMAWKFVCRIWMLVWSVFAWRTYVVAPLTEEIVFRACMIPLLSCGGFKTYKIIFFSPVFFSLAHLHHFWELHYLQRYSFRRASLTVGLQLGYTVIFGWYASFLLIRTGHLISPIVAHMLCNVMGLPLLSSPQLKGTVSIAFVIGAACFFWLLFPATSPDIYNERTDICKCWHGYCSWK